MLTSDSLASIPGVVHGFDSSEPQLPWPFGSRWDERPGPRPSHRRPHPNSGEADGTLTGIANIVLSVMTADCVPLLHARADGSEIAEFHIGWRGALAHIVASAGAMLRAKGGSPAAWRAGIGPSASACCYCFGDDVIA